MPAYVVGYIDWSENELHLERIETTNHSWHEAVALHSKYPFIGEAVDDQVATCKIIPHDFKQACFDYDCMMNWIEL